MTELGILISREFTLIPAGQIINMIASQYKSLPTYSVFNANSKPIPDSKKRYSTSPRKSACSGIPSFNSGYQLLLRGTSTLQLILPSICFDS